MPPSSKEGKIFQHHVFLHLYMCCSPDLNTKHKSHRVEPEYSTRNAAYVTSVTDVHPGDPVQAKLVLRRKKESGDPASDYTFFYGDWCLGETSLEG